jgi:hypothetical protein
MRAVSVVLRHAPHRVGLPEPLQNDMLIDELAAQRQPRVAYFHNLSP